ncbi:MAG: hypothetical protein GY856_16465 [bacterium]|nr:hypothetical protein [bacterium]
MRTLLIEVEDEVVEKLEQVASGQSSRQSEFISMAIRKALWEREEQDTARAYARQPDSAEETYVDPDVWD